VPKVWIGGDSSKGEPATIFEADGEAPEVFAAMEAFFSIRKERKAAEQGTAQPQEPA